MERRPRPRCRRLSEGAGGVGDDGRPSSRAPMDDGADPDVDRPPPIRRGRATDAADELPEGGRDEGRPAGHRPGLARPHDGMSLCRDSVGDPQPRPARRAAGERDPALADPPVERDPEDA